MSIRDWLIVVVLGIGWGAAFIFNAVLLREVGPLSVSFLRIALGAATCWAWVLATGKRVPWGAVFAGQALVLGVVNYAIPFAVYPIAQKYITSGVAGIVNAMMPIMVVIVSHFWPGGERATPAKSLGILFGFAGIVVLTLPALRGGAENEVWAILFTLLAPVCYAVAMNYLRRLKGIDPAVIAAMALTGGALAIAPVMLAAEGVPRIATATGWLSVMGLGVVLTGLAFIVLYAIVPRIGATNASTVTFIAPVSAVLLGHLVLGDTIAPSHLLGMAMIFLGLLAIDGRVLRRFRRAAA
ncbi:DMT family transporter [Tropicimonas sediminicola]|uniref:Permease of the drug/metabolite transporter (DMT) superfamily n=1 Tax=Tropicimonas sediminicola TaxID=1031541 RepID=A0A239CKK8_9RHOB|nr:DMT family transporter [Tropicimonas sediminicola]SNS20776.1 Permease of the drug/metabolite transporter (DMT) superfamily [Tropicimonas sediminicola]